MCRRWVGRAVGLIVFSYSRRGRLSSNNGRNAGRSLATESSSILAHATSKTTKYWLRFFSLILLVYISVVDMRRFGDTMRDPSGE
jgi:hypothetical protein